jgi:hypothetical protein
MSIAISALFLAIGAACYLYSMQGGDPFLVVLAAILVAVTSIPGMLYLGAAAMLGRRPRARNLAILLGGIVACYLLFWFTAVHHLELLEESRAKGDALARSIETHKRQTGAYPRDLAELAARGVAIPTTALGDGEFFYIPSAAGFTLGFTPSPIWYELTHALAARDNCRRSDRSAHWWCYD